MAKFIYHNDGARIPNQCAQCGGYEWHHLGLVSMATVPEPAYKDAHGAESHGPSNVKQINLETYACLVCGSTVFIDWLKAWRPLS